MTYKDYIESKKRKWTGKDVKYEGKIHKVIGIDYNGMLLINKKAHFTDTIAISELNVILCNMGQL